MSTNGQDARLTAGAPDTRSASGWARLGIGLSMIAALMGSTLSSPLYSLYQSQWGLSSLWVNSLFAAYAIGVVAALTLMARYGDQLNDRRVAIASALVLVIFGAAIMAFAPNPVTLLIGRIVAGVGTGTLIGSASAALLELQPHGDARVAAAQSTAAFTLGSAGGPLLSGYFIHINAWPEVVPYLAIIVLAAVAMIGALSKPLPIHKQAPDSQTDDRYVSPLAERAHLKIATMTLVFGWCIGSVFMVSGPKFALDLAGTKSLFLASALIGGFQLAAGLGQVMGKLFTQTRAVLGGALLAALSQGVMCVSAIQGTSLPFEIACIFAGFGYGVSFVGATGLVNRLSRPQDRVRLISRYYVIGYIFGNAAPTVIVGAGIDHYGLQAALIGLTSAAILMCALIIWKLHGAKRL